MKPGIAMLLVVVAAAGGFFAGWQVGRTHAPAVERPAPPTHTAVAETPAAPAAATTAPTSAAPAAPDAPKNAAPAAPKIADPTDAAGLAEAIRKAFASGNKQEAMRLGEKLKAWIGDDADRALQVLAMFDGETNPETLDALFRFLGDKFLKDAHVREKVLEIATTHADPAHQAKALDFLRRAIEKDPAFADSIPQTTVQQILGMMRTSPSDDVRAQAARLLCRFTDRPGVMEAMRDVAINFRETSEAAREAALESLRLSQDPAALDTLFTVMQQDPDDKVRRKAAESLAIMAPQQRKDDVVRQIDSLLSTEKSWDVKGLLVMSLVRVAPDQALPVLQRASAREGDPKAKARLDVVTGILSDGERDPFKILMKSQVGIQRLEAQGK